MSRDLDRLKKESRDLEVAGLAEQGIEALERRARDLDDEWEEAEDLVSMLYQMRDGERPIPTGFSVTPGDVESAEEERGRIDDQRDLVREALRMAYRDAPEAEYEDNPHAPTVHEILERPFPLDLGFWGFEVAKQAGDDQDFGYLAPPGVVIEALPGETVVAVRPAKLAEKIDLGEFEGALAVFTSKPIPADKVIEFGLYPDFHAMPHFLLEITAGADAIELVNNDKYRKGDVALIHLDTYPEHERTHKGKIQKYRISYFDKHGPSGHRNGTLLELIKDALSSGYRVLSPGALDRLSL